MHQKHKSQCGFYPKLLGFTKNVLNDNFSEFYLVYNCCLSEVFGVIVTKDTKILFEQFWKFGSYNWSWLHFLIHLCS